MKVVLFSVKRISPTSRHDYYSKDTERMDEKSRERRKLSTFAVNLGLVANGALAVMKTAVGVAGGSPALLADGINSTSDVAYGVVMSICIRHSSKPADHEHPYGHEQMESIAAVVVGAFVICTAIAIFWNSVNSVLFSLGRQGRISRCCKPCPVDRPVDHWSQGVVDVVDEKSCR